MDASELEALLTEFSEKLQEPASEDLEKASKEWLTPQLDKSYANYGETKMMELTHFDGYAMLDAVEFGAQWQKERDQKELQIAEEHGILTGMNMEHEKLMKDAVVVSFVQDYKYKTPILTGDIKKKFALTTGQHVKLIIVKDE